MKTEYTEKSDESVLQNVNGQSQVAINRQYIDNTNRSENLRNVDESSEEISEIFSRYSNNSKNKALEQ